MRKLEYLRPADVTEALAGLSRPGAAVVAGGTDLMISVRDGSFSGDRLVDVTGVAEMRGLTPEDDRISLGAIVKIEELRQSPLVREKLPALARAAEVFAGLQIRNMATIGGNVGHAAPCGDTHPPLILYDGVGEVAGPEGRSFRPVAELFAGPERSALKPGELLVRFLVRPEAATLADFQKIGRRKDLAISRVSLAVLVNVDASGLIDRCKIVLGACMPITRRMPSTETLLTGHKPDRALLREAAALMASEMIDITGRRVSVVYKEPAIQGLLLRMLDPLLRRA